MAIPALLTRTSRCEHCCERMRAAAATLSSLETSISTHCTSSPSARKSAAARVPRSASLAPSQTLNPSIARRRATSRPIPLLAPVTRARFAAVILESPCPVPDNGVLARSSPQGKARAAPCRGGGRANPQPSVRSRIQGPRSQSAGPRASAPQRPYSALSVLIPDSQQHLPSGVVVVGHQVPGGVVELAFELIREVDSLQGDPEV